MQKTKRKKEKQRRMKDKKPKQHIALRLWQKIYLAVFCLAAFLLAFMAALWQKNSFQTMLLQEQNSAASDHAYITSTLQNLVTTEQARTSTNGWDTDALYQCITLSLKYQIKQDCAVYTDDVRIASNNSATDSQKDSYCELVQTANYTMTVVSDGDSYLCFTTSLITLSGNAYTLVSIRDLTDLYTQLKSSTQKLFYMYGVGAIILGFALFFLIRRLLRPLQKMDANMTAIAHGDYEIRIPENRRDELGDMAANMNRMAEAISQNVSQLQQVAEDRKKFIDNLSHEMKTPLTSILGYADLLTMVENIDAQTRVTYANVILSECRRLRTLSDKLMELITVGKLNSTEMHPVSILPIIADLKLAVQPSLSGKDITLLVQTEPFVILADRELLKSMLYNFIDNARKASAKQGKILLKTGVKNNVPYVAVVDYGIGIPQDELEHIMKPFYMVDKSRSRKEGGAGLGLSLCSEIAKLHNAHITMKSKEQQGTTVLVTFPPFKPDMEEINLEENTH